MTDPQEQTLSSRWRTLWQNEVHAQGFTLDAWQRSMVESLAQATMALQQEHPTALTPRVKCVTARFTLKLTPLHTRQGMEYLSRELNFLRRTAPAIHAHVCSLMRVYQPWCLLANIETTLGSDY